MVFMFIAFFNVFKDFFLSTALFAIWNKIKQGPIWKKKVLTKKRVVSQKDIKQGRKTS